MGTFVIQRDANTLRGILKFYPGFHIIVIVVIQWATESHYGCRS